jgi:hypothetical protein
VRLRLAVALSALAAVAPTAALAAHLTGTPRADRLVGSAGADTIDGRAGNDVLDGLGGNDLLIGGLGRDRLSGGRGDDSLAANGDGARDTVACGPGQDIVDADLADSVAKDCEVLSRQLSTDTVDDGGGQHATEVEPDSFSAGSTLVAVFQVGRVSTGGATAIGFATTKNSGATWRSGLLPGVTSLSPQPGVDPRASDPTVGYDAVHNVWLASSLGIAGDHFELLVSRSVDGVVWQRPIVARRGPGGSLDKEWVACDNWSTSPNAGHCYLSYLDTGPGLIVTQTSTDGGLTWGVPVQTSIQPATGTEPNGAQPLPRADGGLVVVYALGGEQGPSLSDAVLATTSTDGGASFGPSVTISTETSAAVPGMRAPPLPSADIAADGRIYVVWHDCRFDPGCTRNRIVLSTSPDGQTWSAPAAIAATATGTTQFVPGIAVDPGSKNLVGLAFYTLSTRCVVAASCPQIDVWSVRSSDAGRTWAKPKRLDTEPMQLSWLPQAEGRFLGDYMSVSFLGDRSVPVYALAVTPWGGKLREAIMALQRG